MSDIKNVRIEEDLLGTKEVSNDLYYGVHTLRAVENFKISTQKISDVPEFVRGMVLTKKAAALANGELGTIRPEIADKIIEACDLMLNTGKCFDQFPVDVYQGGAGTSVNMNTNEVLANMPWKSWVWRRAVTTSSTRTTTSTSASPPMTPTPPVSASPWSTAPTPPCMPWKR